MRSSRIVHAICATLDAFVFGFMPSSAKAQQINGILDSPPATQSIYGSQQVRLFGVGIRV